MPDVATMNNAVIATHYLLGELNAMARTEAREIHSVAAADTDTAIEHSLYRSGCGQYLACKP